MQCRGYSTGLVERSESVWRALQLVIRGANKEWLKPTPPITRYLTESPKPLAPSVCAKSVLRLVKLTTLDLRCPRETAGQKLNHGLTGSPLGDSFQNNDARRAQVRVHEFCLPLRDRVVLL